MNSPFATDMYAQLASQEGNLFFSPVSIQTALAMTWAGAKGPTADEMSKTLHLDPNPATHDAIGAFLGQLNADGKKRNYELHTANAIWTLRGFPLQPDYVDLVKKKYLGGLSQLDFIKDAEGSRQVINRWVAEETHDRIKDLIAAGMIKEDTRLVLTNAIYFKAAWDLQFRKAFTQDGEFTASGGAKSTVPFMHQQSHFAYAEDDEVQVLEMTYGDYDLAMRVFLPKHSDGLAEFEKKLGAERVAALVANLRGETVKVWFPRFKMDTQFSLGQTLQAMGMKLAFDPQHADFSGMTTAQPLYIGLVVHKAFVSVDEEGTEAAAATAVIMRAGSARQIDPPQPKIFRADHPFLFEIVHRRGGATLFMGRVAKP